MSINAAVAIYIIELEIPPQLLLHLPPENEAEGGHVFHEVNVSVLRENKAQIVTGADGGTYGCRGAVPYRPLDSLGAQRLGIRKKL